MSLVFPVRRLFQKCRPAIGTTVFYSVYFVACVWCMWIFLFIILLNVIVRNAYSSLFTGMVFWSTYAHVPHMFWLWPGSTSNHVLCRPVPQQSRRRYTYYFFLFLYFIHQSASRKRYTISQERHNLKNSTQQRTRSNKINKWSKNFDERQHRSRTYHPHGGWLSPFWNRAFPSPWVTDFLRPWSASSEDKSAAMQCCCGRLLFAHSNGGSRPPLSTTQMASWSVHSFL